MKRLATIVVLGVVLGACGGSTPAGSGGSDEPTPNGDAGAAGDFAALLKEGFADADFRITYDLKTGGQTTTITWSQKPPKRSFRVGEGDASFLVIDDGTDTVVCTGAQFCARSDDDSGLGGADAFLAPLFDLRDSVTDAGTLPGFSSKGSKTIAGRAATCGSWTYGGQGTEVCVDAEVGILLSWSFTGNQAASAAWEATDFGEPKDEDFEPTAPIQQLPSSG